jgi:hypothetical protein
MCLEIYTAVVLVAAVLCAYAKCFAATCFFRYLCYAVGCALHHLQCTRTNCVLCYVQPASDL